MSWLLDRNCFRSESTLKSIKLQYGAEIDGWRAKYEEAQVKISENQRNTGENQCFQYFHCLSWFSFFRVFSPSCKTTLAIWRLKTGNSVLSIKVQARQLFSILFSFLNKRLSDLDGGEGDYIILQGDKRQVPFRIRREQMIEEGIFRPIFGPKTFLKVEFEDKMLFLGLRIRWAFSRRGIRPLLLWRQRSQRCKKTRILRNISHKKGNSLLN